MKAWRLTPSQWHGLARWERQQILWYEKRQQDWRKARIEGLKNDKGELTAEVAVLLQHESV